MNWLKKRIQKLAGMKIKKTEESSETKNTETTQILTEHEEVPREQENREENEQ